MGTSTRPLLAAAVLAMMVASFSAAQHDAFPEAGALRRDADTLGKASWRPMLRYAADLHVRSTHPATGPFVFAWEEIGPGYGYGPAFGHWDIVHQVIDVLPSAPEHARQQLLNDVRLQLPNGYLPGSIWMPGSPAARGGRPTFDPDGQSHPPLWVVAADDYMRATGDRRDLREFFTAAVRQIAWFERARTAEPGSFYYADVLARTWESGIDEGVRFDAPVTGTRACVDATSHVHQLYVLAAQWASQLGEDPSSLKAGADRTGAFIRTRLWAETEGYFYDAWAVERAAARSQTFEGLWPVIVGAASQGQAQRVIEEWVLNPQRFLTPHPIATVGVSDPKFEVRMWRGAAWNSMTYWVARACVRYGRPDVAVRLLDAALDGTAAQFLRTGTMWEFYHPLGGRAEDVARKPGAKPSKPTYARRNQPWTDYLGHNPVLAMARLWRDAISWHWSTAIPSGPTWLGR